MNSKEKAIELVKQEEFWKALNSYGSAIPENVKFSLANDFHKILIKDSDNWIKIESEKDLPSDTSKNYAVGFLNDKGHFTELLENCSPLDVRTGFELEEITHFQPIENRKPPIH